MRSAGVISFPICIVDPSASATRRTFLFLDGAFDRLQQEGELPADGDARTLLMDMVTVLTRRDMNLSPSFRGVYLSFGPFSKKGCASGEPQLLL